jgi:1,4-dihydroxy-6-naphthoate synthase
MRYSRPPVGLCAKENRVTATEQLTKKLIRVGHSPDPDDAFMFYALAKDKIETGEYQFTHELVDIETLNRRAFGAELELTALSIHAYAFLHDKYVLCTCGASMGDGYGPMVVTKTPQTLDAIKTQTIAVPGKLTSAYLALRLCLDKDFKSIEVPFDEIIPAAVAGEYGGQKIDAGLIIHEGQLTYGDQDLKLVVDLGVWWKERTGLPLPLGANGIRKSLGPETIHEVQRLLYESIDYGLEHREPALSYALQYGRDLDAKQADKFVGMYVNDWTRDFGDRGRTAVAEFLKQGYEAGILPKLVVPEFAD